MAEHMHAKHMHVNERERGTALLVTTLVIFMVLLLAGITVNTSVVRSRASLDETTNMILLADAEAGLGAKFDYILEHSSAAAQIEEDHTLTTADSTVQVVGDNVSGDVYRITSTATRPDPAGNGNLNVRLTAHITAARHPAFYKAVYVGNKHGFPVPVKLGPTQNLSQTVSFDESVVRNDDYRLNEADLGIDFNNDGDLNDEPRIRWLYGNGGSQYQGPYPGWGPTQSATNMEQTGGYNGDYRIDLDGDGSFGTYSNTIVNAPEFASPTGSETPDTNWENTVFDDRDYIEGDTYVNGDVEVRAYTEVFGTIDATGTIQGSNVPGSGDLNDGVDPITPPDLHAENYEGIADEIVTKSKINNGDYSGVFYPERSGSFYGNLGNASGMDNDVIHLGPTSGGNDVANFSTSDSGKLFFVKGNLWLHHNNSKFLKLPSSKSLTLTIVVEGNLYIGDDLQYQNANSGVLFMVKGKTDDPNTPEREDESFLDANKNFKYDVGETIINDDGDGTYEGPVEGQGNVYFGDAKFGTGGVTDGFMYAENNAYLMDPSTASNPVTPVGKDRIYGVKGFLSAGGVLDLGDRTLGTDYYNYKVQYDQRIEDGTLNFKGIPRDDSGFSFQLVSWQVEQFRN